MTCAGAAASRVASAPGPRFPGRRFPPPPDHGFPDGQVRGADSSAMRNVPGRDGFKEPQLPLGEAADFFVPGRGGVGLGGLICCWAGCACGGPVRPGGRGLVRFVACRLRRESSTCAGRLALGRPYACCGACCGAFRGACCRTVLQDRAAGPGCRAGRRCRR